MKEINLKDLLKLGQQRQTLYEQIKLIDLSNLKEFVNFIIELGGKVWLQGGAARELIINAYFLTAVAINDHDIIILGTEKMLEALKTKFGNDLGKLSNNNPLLLYKGKEIAHLCVPNTAFDENTKTFDEEVFAQKLKTSLAGRGLKVNSFLIPIGKDGVLDVTRIIDQYDGYSDVIKRRLSSIESRVTVFGQQEKELKKKAYKFIRLFQIFDLLSKHKQLNFSVQKKLFDEIKVLGYPKFFKIRPMLLSKIYNYFLRTHRNEIFKRMVQYGCADFFFPKFANVKDYFTCVLNTQFDIKIQRNQYEVLARLYWPLFLNEVIENNYSFKYTFMRLNQDGLSFLANRNIIFLWKTWADALLQHAKNPNKPLKNFPDELLHERLSKFIAVLPKALEERQQSLLKAAEEMLFEKFENALATKQRSPETNENKFDENESLNKKEIRNSLQPNAENNRKKPRFSPNSPIEVNTLEIGSKKDKRKMKQKENNGNTENTEEIADDGNAKTPKNIKSYKKNKRRSQRNPINTQPVLNEQPDETQLHANSSKEEQVDDFAENGSEDSLSSFDGRTEESGSQSPEEFHENGIENPNDLNYMELGEDSLLDDNSEEKQQLEDSEDEEKDAITVPQQNFEDSKVAMSAEISLTDQNNPVEARSDNKEPTENVTEGKKEEENLTELVPTIVVTAVPQQSFEDNEVVMSAKMTLTDKNNNPVETKDGNEKHIRKTTENIQTPSLQNQKPQFSSVSSIVPEQSKASLSKGKEENTEINNRRGKKEKFVQKSLPKKTPGNSGFWSSDKNVSNVSEPTGVHKSTSLQKVDYFNFVSQQPFSFDRSDLRTYFKGVHVLAASCLTLTMQHMVRPERRVGNPPINFIIFLFLILIFDHANAYRLRNNASKNQDKMIEGSIELKITPESLFFASDTSNKNHQEWITIYANQLIGMIDETLPILVKRLSFIDLQNRSSLAVFKRSQQLTDFKKVLHFYMIIALGVVVMAMVSKWSENNEQPIDFLPDWNLLKVGFGFLTLGAVADITMATANEYIDNKSLRKNAAVAQANREKIQTLLESPKITPNATKDLHTLSKAYELIQQTFEKEVNPKYRIWVANRMLVLQKIFTKVSSMCSVDTEPMARKLDNVMKDLNARCGSKEVSQHLKTLSF